MQKALFHRILLGLGALAVTLPMQAQLPLGSHYPVGAEGIKGASLPPPGVYLRDYNFFYSADKVAGLPADVDVLAYVQVPRLIWISRCEIFGANCGMDIIAPFFYKQLSGELGGGEKFGLGDVQLEPLLLSWHEKKFDVAAGYAIWAPTGNFDSSTPEKLLTSPGNGFWTHMLTLGATWYPHESKKLSVSALSRYEISTEQDQTHITPGDTYTLEWGVGKKLHWGFDAGVVGYYQQQVTKDSGAGASKALAHVVGVGPEVSKFWAKAGLFTSVRYVRETDAANRPQGQTLTLTFTKPF
jgi:hypothetical protein